MFTEAAGGYEAGMTDRTRIHFTVPGIGRDEAGQIIDLLQRQLNHDNALHLTLKHVHWNVVGPNFIGVHEMLDPQIDAVRTMADQVAERIATLGGSPNGTPGALAGDAEHDTYPIGRADTVEHLEALDMVYRNVIGGSRTVADELDKLDLVTQDLIVEHLHSLELFHWFVRAHLESPTGRLATDE